MNERAIQFRVGVMVLATLLIAAILVVMFNEPRSLIRGKYTVTVTFPQAPGVSKDTPIRKSGILIGRVSKVDLDDGGGAVVTLNIDGDRKLRRNEVFRIVTSLLGDSVVDVVPSIDPNAPTTFIEGGESLRGVTASDPIQVIGNLEDSLAKAIGSVADTSSKLGEVVERVGNLLQENEQEIDSVIAKLDRSLTTFEQTVNNANEVIDDPETRKQLKESIAQIPEVLSETRETIEQMGKAVTLVEQNLQNIENFTRPLGENGEVLVNRINRGTARLELLMDEMHKFSKSLNDGQGSLGQLVNNPELYQSLNRAARNIEEVSGQLRPIIKDARVFTDKIARHPEKLGVRGAIQRSSGIK